MNAFLDVNSFIPRERMFVDDYSFDAYRAAGFGRFDQLDKDAVKDLDIKMTAPELGFGEWMGYFSTVGKVTPIPEVCFFLNSCVWVSHVYIFRLFCWCFKLR